MKMKCQNRYQPDGQTSYDDHRYNRATPRRARTKQHTPIPDGQPSPPKGLFVEIHAAHRRTHARVDSAHGTDGRLRERHRATGPDEHAARAPGRQRVRDRRVEQLVELGAPGQERDAAREDHPVEPGADRAGVEHLHADADGCASFYDRRKLGDQWGEGCCSGGYENGSWQ